MGIWEIGGFDILEEWELVKSFIGVGDKKEGGEEDVCACANGWEISEDVSLVGFYCLLVFFYLLVLRC